MPLALPVASDPHDRYYRLKELVSVYYDATIRETINYGKETADSLSVAIAIYILLCVFLYMLFAYIWKGFPQSNGHLSSAKRVMFVIAHPDDECMFFGPAIMKLAQQKDCELFLLCLSTGNYDNMGEQRKKELWESCRILGIPDSNITLVKSSFLPDDGKAQWREDILAAHIQNHVEALSIDTVITFDKHGVSKHANHCSLFYALALLCVEKKLPKYCRAYALETTSVLRKYSFILDIPLSYITSSSRYIVSLKDRHTIKCAMHAHASQLVWFRYLYLMFSRYLFINTLNEIDILDLELDMDIEPELRQVAKLR